MHASVFDIVGPVMIGPSSSHTAGAARIGRMGRRLLKEPVREATILLYGSFLMTYHGHGTDRAILAGLMDMGVGDVRIRDSFHYAQEAGIRYTFGEAHLRQAHPNTVVMHLVGESGRQVDMQACSVGGGAIRVEKLNGLPVSFTGQEHTLIIPHLDQPGKIAAVTNCAASFGVNIGSMSVFRDRAGGTAVMIMETDGEPREQMLEWMRALPGVEDVIFIPREA
ncbi:MAG: L-serine ammonia-lyase, iron-sulfur-dependent subunit beta [Clostridia bacterium]|nr:L-serine ammonia-lyase, iron-sulfur-dependent subunit beta [Clostridia bacterium]